jgi:hypothetical protein
MQKAAARLNRGRRSRWRWFWRGCRRVRAIGRFVNSVVKGKERYVDTEASQPANLGLGPEPAVPAS